MIGIIGAMTVEVEGIKKLMTEKCDKVISGMTYTSGMLCDKKVVVTVCGEGKVNAAMCTQTMILEYKPKMIINSGVAGGIAKGLKVCDAVIADAVVQHDMDMSPLGHPKGYICGIDGVEMICDKKIKETLFECAKQAGVNSIYGIVATGDQFISDNEKKSWLIDTFNASACEMEGGAIGHVCKRNNVPFGVLRTISDGGDDEAKMSFPEFAALAAENSIKIMQLFIEKI